jgi:putative transposase
VIEDDDHLLTVFRYIEANPVRAKMVERASEYRWSSYASHARDAANELLSVCQPYEQMSAYAAVRQRRWEAYVDQTPDADELAAIQRSEKLSNNLELDLTVRPRGRPKKSTTEANK